MQSVFQKFGGIRPMAARLGIPPSTVKSWHTKQFIPEWRRPAVIDTAKRLGIAIIPDEVENVCPDTETRTAA